MAFYNKTADVFKNSFPIPTDGAVGGQLFSNGTSAYWSYPGNPQSTPGNGFQFRSIFTHGYLAGGYKGSCPWRSVNRTWHATDITMYLGEQLAYAANYLEGTFSDFNGYIHNTADAYATASAGTQSYSLANGTLRTRGSGTYSPAGTGFGDVPSTGTTGTGGWNLSAVRGPYLGCAVDQINQAGYITGGGTQACDKLHFGSETMYTTTAPAAAGYANGAHGQTTGYVSFDTPASKLALSFSSNTWKTYPATHIAGWYKMLSTKLGWHYNSDVTNTTAFSKFSDATGVDILIGAVNSKLGTFSEENFQMGQNWGYCLGNYDGAQQNNMTLKYNYLTDVVSSLGTAARPKGHFGQSSACCSSAAATVASSNASAGY